MWPCDLRRRVVVQNCDDEMRRLFHCCSNWNILLCIENVTNICMINTDNHKFLHLSIFSWPIQKNWYANPAIMKSSKFEPHINTNPIQFQFFIALKQLENDRRKNSCKPHNYLIIIFNYNWKTPWNLDLCFFFLPKTFRTNFVAKPSNYQNPGEPWEMNISIYNASFNLIFITWTIF